MAIIPITEELLNDVAKFLLRYDEKMSIDRANYLLDVIHQIQNDSAKVIQLSNSLADEITLNLNLSQTNKILEIMRHKQDEKIEKEIENKIQEYSNSGNSPEEGFTQNVLVDLYNSIKTILENEKIE